MNQSSLQPHLSGDGVVFSVIVDSVRHECVITPQALYALSAYKTADDDVDVMEIFRAYEPNINGVARRLVAAGVAGDPLVLRPATFRPPHTQ